MAKPETTQRRICWPLWVGLMWGVFITVPLRVSPDQLVQNLKAWGELL